MEIKLYVGNLAYSTTEGDLRRLFAQAGNVTSVDLIKDRETGQSKGFAFVVMGTPTQAHKAIGMFHAYSLAGRELKVTAARPRAEHGGYQSRLGAFSPAGRELKVTAAKPRAEHGGYQSRLSAFAKGGNPAGHRHRGRRQRS